jgi:predicted regulator of Ras-like GTPase activity (Roadblock/LC7/MglB family)
MKDMILFPEDIERLDGILAPLAGKAKLLLAVLINRDGQIITHQGSMGKVDVVSLAALVAGNTASTLAIANLVGETEFSAMYHQGRDRHIYIDAVDENTYLAVVFDNQTNVDRVRVFIRQFSQELREALAAVYNKSEDSIDLDLGIPTEPMPSAQPSPLPLADDEPPAGSQDAYLYLLNKRRSAPPASGR